MAVDDLFETTWGWSASGNPLVNVVHFRQTIYDGSSNLPALCVILLQAIELVMISDWKPIGSTAVSLISLECFVVNDPTSAGTEPTSVTGDITGELLPLRSAAVAKKSTNFRGRSFRGRMFLPPMVEANQNGGVIVGARRVELDDWLEEIRIVDDGAGNTFRMTIFSPTLSDPPMDIFVDTPVTTIIVQLNLGSIRKRQDVS